MKKVFQPRQSHKGFTLIEVLVAVVILAGVIIAAATIEAKQVKNSAGNKQQLEALGIAQKNLNLSKQIFDNDMLNPASPQFPSDGIYALDDSANPDLVPQGSISTTEKCDTGGVAGKKVIVGSGANAREYCVQIEINTP